MATTGVNGWTRLDSKEKHLTKGKSTHKNTQGSQVFGSLKSHMEFGFKTHCRTHTWFSPVFVVQRLEPSVRPSAALTGECRGPWGEFAFHWPTAAPTGANYLQTQMRAPFILPPRSGENISFFFCLYKALQPQQDQTDGKDFAVLST